MKQLINNYIFDPIGKTVKFNQVFNLNQILLITNVNTNQIIYNFASTGFGGTINDSTLTLDFDTSTMLSTDELQIFVDVEDDIKIRSESLLMRILNTLMSPLGYDKSLQRYRQTAVIENGTITVVNSVANQVAIGGIQGQILVNGGNLSAWQASVRARIS